MLGFFGGRVVIGPSFRSGQEDISALGKLFNSLNGGDKVISWSTCQIIMQKWTLWSEASLLLSSPT